MPLAQISSEPYGSAIDWLRKTLRAGSTPSPPEGQQTLSDMLMSLAVPKTAQEAAMASLPGPAFTAEELSSKLLPPMRKHGYEFLSELQDLLKGDVAKSNVLYRKRLEGGKQGIVDFLQRIESGQESAGLHKALERLYPEVYKPIELEIPSGNTMAASNWGLPVIKFNPREIMASMLHPLNPYSPSISRTPEALLPFLTGHELGHQVFRRPTPAMLSKGIKPAEFLTELNERLGGVNEARFAEILEKLRQTDLGRTLRMIEGPSRDLGQRASYWREKMPLRLPNEEYFADAIGARVAGLPEASQFPIDWSYFEGLFRQ